MLKMIRVYICIKNLDLRKWEHLNKWALNLINGFDATFLQLTLATPEFLRRVIDKRGSIGKSCVL